MVNIGQFGSVKNDLGDKPLGMPVKEICVGFIDVGRPTLTPDNTIPRAGSPRLNKREQAS